MLGNRQSDWWQWQVSANMLLHRLPPELGILCDYIHIVLRGSAWIVALLSSHLVSLYSFLCCASPLMRKIGNATRHCDRHRHIHESGDHAWTRRRRWSRHLWLWQKDGGWMNTRQYVLYTYLFLYDNLMTRHLLITGHLEPWHYFLRNGHCPSTL